MQPSNNDIIHPNSTLNLANISHNIETTNISNADNIPLINAAYLSMPLNNRQIENNNTTNNCYAEYTPGKFIELLQNNKLPNKPIHVLGSIDIIDNTEITELPANLTITERLQLKKCPNIKSIPAGLKVTTLSINECINLKDFAENIKVDNLQVLSCQSLSKFNNTIVNKNLLINQCCSIRSLPKFSDQLKNIYLCFNDNVIMPDNIKTLGDVILLGCNRINVLPENMDIGGNLDIDNLVHLIKLPDKLKVHGDIIVSNCHGLSLTPLPATWLVNIPDSLPVTPGVSHLLEFQYNGIAPDHISFYDENTPENIYFIQPQNILNTKLERLISLWQVYSINKDFIEIKDITDAERADLQQFLYQLTKTASVAYQDTKKYLAEQIINILKLIANNTEIKEQALAIINNSISACEDRISLGLADLDFLPLLFKAKKQSKTDKQGITLLSVAKQKLYIEEIKEYAKMNAQEKNSSAEEVEFILSYLIKLSIYFSLPITVNEMKYESIANISDADVDIAYEVINTKVTNEYFNQWLKNYEPWQQHIRLWSIKKYVDLKRKYIDNNDIDKNSCCIISLDILKDIKDPVYYKEKLYSYESLCKWYIEHGTNPLNPSETINIADIYLLQIDEVDDSNVPKHKKTRKH